MVLAGPKSGICTEFLKKHLEHCQPTTRLGQRLSHAVSPK